MKKIYPFLMLVGCLWMAGNAQSFYNPLPIPPLLQGDTIKLEVEARQHNFDPLGSSNLNTLINTFGYDELGSTVNTYLGPTLIWNRGQRQYTHVTNKIPNQQTTVHWHGAHIPPWTDGGPHQVIDSNSTWKIDFDILEHAATMWYHPHLHDKTFTQVEMGLSGVIIIDDANDTLDPQLPHTYGVDDFPIILQDRQFKLDSGSNTWYIDTLQNGGPTIIVNGVVNPYLEVPAQMVRFRFLDGSSRKTYLIGVGDASKNKQSMTLIASDAGYTPGPIPVDSFLTGPGIRNEFVVDFSGFQAGDSAFLWNFGTEIPNVDSFIANKSDVQLLKFVVTAPTANPIVSLPATFPPQETWDPADADTTRVKELTGRGGQGNTGNPNLPPIPFTINGNQYELDVVNDIVLLDAIEIWEIWNRSSVAHPFHIHDIHFQVIEVWDSAVGTTIPIPNEYLGPQDNILVPSGWKVSFITQFSDFGTSRGPNDYDSTYMYHCHILTHEDGYYAVSPGQSRDHVGMMQQFLVWNGTFSEVDAAEGVGGADAPTFFPNPAHDLLHLKGESNRASELRVFDLRGKLVMREELVPFKGVKSFPVDHLGAGMYLVEWHADGKRTTEKIVLQRD